MTRIDDFFTLKRKVEGLKGRRDETRGAIRQLRKRIADVHGVKDRKAAKARLKELQARHAKLNKVYAAAYAEFRRVYKDTLARIEE